MGTTTTTLFGNEVSESREIRPGSCNSFISDNHDGDDMPPPPPPPQMMNSTPHLARSYGCNRFSSNLRSSHALPTKTTTPAIAITTTAMTAFMLAVCLLVPLEAEALTSKVNGTTTPLLSHLSEAYETVNHADENNEILTSPGEKTINTEPQYFLENSPLTTTLEETIRNAVKNEIEMDQNIGSPALLNAMSESEKALLVQYPTVKNYLPSPVLLVSETKTEDLKENSKKTEDLKENSTKTEDLKGNAIQTEDLKENLTKTELLKEDPTKIKNLKDNATKNNNLKENATKIEDLKNDLIKKENLKEHPVKTEDLKDNPIKIEDLEKSLTKTEDLKENPIDCNENNGNTVCKKKTEDQDFSPSSTLPPIIEHIEATTSLRDSEIIPVTTQIPPKMPLKKIEETPVAETETLENENSQNNLREARKLENLQVLQNKEKNEQIKEELSVNRKEPTNLDNRTEAVSTDEPVIPSENLPISSDDSSNKDQLVEATHIQQTLKENEVNELKNTIPETKPEEEKKEKQEEEVTPTIIIPTTPKTENALPEVNKADNASKESNMLETNVAPSAGIHIEENPNMVIQNDTLSIVFEEPLTATEPIILLEKENLNLKETIEIMHTTIQPEVVEHNVIKKQGVEPIDPETLDKLNHIPEEIPDTTTVTPMKGNIKIYPIEKQESNIDEVQSMEDSFENEKTPAEEPKESFENKTLNSTMEEKQTLNNANEGNDSTTFSPVQISNQSDITELSVVFPGKGDDDAAEAAAKGSRSINSLQGGVALNDNHKASINFDVYPAGQTFNENLAEIPNDIGKALPTHHINDESANRSTLIITLCSCTALIFIIISVGIFLVSFQRQHGTLDIEMQEQCCGKDNTNDEDSETRIKLLEVELPNTSLALQTDAEAEIEECL